MVAHGGAGLLRARIRGRSVLRWPALSLSVRTGPDGGSDPWVLPESWRAPMSDYCSSPAYEALRGFVEAERTRAHVLPAPHETFAALERCDFDAVRVVILGQDPYPTPGHAHGLAFSVRPGVRPPGSLRNIFKELQQDVGASVSPHGYLDAWAQQGVLLLNAVLTVRASEAASHTDVGWEDFTSMIVSRLAERRRGLVFLLWGKMAQSRARLVDKGAHCVLRAAHPSPLSAQRGFFGCRHFSRCNAYLSSHGKPPIEWALPPLFPAARDPTAPEPAPTSPSKPAGAAVRRSSTDAPPRWREQLDAIEQARAGRDAPVDFLGCHTLGRAADGDEACRFQTLVALILAARSSDVAVADAMQRLRLLVAHDGPVCLETVEALDQTLLLAALSGYPVAVAFPPSKARYILGTCAALRHTHDGRVPRELDELRQLPGVGPKAAHLAQLAMWGKAEGIAVDSHVLRICNRLGWTGPSGPVKSAETARRRVEAWLPRQRWAELNPLLVGFGQQRCSEVEPRCGDCSLMLGELCAGVSRTWGQR